MGGLVYWDGLYPIHSLIFGRMLRGVAARTTQFNRRGIGPSRPRTAPMKIANTR